MLWLYLVIIDSAREKVQNRIGYGDGSVVSQFVILSLPLRIIIRISGEHLGIIQQLKLITILRQYSATQPLQAGVICFGKQNSSIGGLSWFSLANRNQSKQVNGSQLWSTESETVTFIGELNIKHRFLKFFSFYRNHFYVSTTKTKIVKWMRTNRFVCRIDDSATVLFIFEKRYQMWETTSTNRRILYSEAAAYVRDNNIYQLC